MDLFNDSDTDDGPAFSPASPPAPAVAAAGKKPTKPVARAKVWAAKYPLRAFPAPVTAEVEELWKTALAQYELDYAAWAEENPAAAKKEADVKMATEAKRKAAAASKAEPAVAAVAAPVEKKRKAPAVAPAAVAKKPKPDDAQVAPPAVVTLFAALNDVISRFVAENQ